jgi:hypothetical protein
MTRPRELFTHVCERVIERVDYMPEDGWRWRRFGRLYSRLWRACDRHVNG